MTNEVSDNGEPVGFYIGLNRTADIRNSAALPGEFYALEKALLRDINELLCLGRDLSAGEGCGTISMEASDVGSHIDGNDVPFLQYPVVRDPVNDGLVHGDTGAGRIPIIVEEGWGCAL